MPDGPAIVRINLFVRSIMTISDIKMVSCTETEPVNSISALEIDRLSPTTPSRSDSLALSLAISLCLLIKKLENTKVVLVALATS